MIKLEKIRQKYAGDIAVLISLTIFFSAIVIKSYKPWTFLSGDACFYAQINRSIVRDLTLRQEKFHPNSWYKMDLGWNKNLDMAWSNISVGKNGEWYPKHPYLISFFSTPFYILFGTSGLVIFNLLMAILCMFFAYLIASRLFSEKIIPSIVTFLISVHPIWTKMIYNYSNDVFYAFLCTSGFFFSIKKQGFIGGVLLGLSIFAKPTNIIFVIPVAGFLFFTLSREEFFKLCAGISIPVGIFLILNFIMYGNPFLSSYDRILTLVNGKEKIVSYNKALNAPMLSGLRNLLLDRNEGIINNFYIIFLLPLGLLLLLIKNPLFGISLLISFLGFFLFHSKFSYIYARFFLPWTAISVIPMSYLVSVLSTLSFPQLKISQSALNFKKKKFLIISGIIFFLSFIFKFSFGFFSSKSLSLHSELENLKIYANGIPCDYFHMAFNRWECSHIEGGEMEFTGEDIRGECRVLGKEKKLLWVPLPSNIRERKIVWDVELKKKRKAILFYGFLKTSANLSLLIDNEKVFEENVTEPKKLKSKEIFIDEGKHRITLIFSSTGFKEVISCVDLTIK